MQDKGISFTEDVRDSYNLVSQRIFSLENGLIKLMDLNSNKNWMDGFMIEGNVEIVV
jgi:hypothetical protein